MKLRFEVDDDDALDFLSKGFHSNNAHEGVGDNGPFTRQFRVPKGTATHTIKIDTKVDPKKCRDGQIKITLVDGDTENDGNQGNYNFPLLGSAPKETIPVRDDGPCSTISIDPDPALERDGVTEGGVFDFTLRRVNPINNEPQVRLNWEVVDDGSLDVLPAAQEGPVPILYFLAGLTCTEETATIKAGAQAHASRLGLALVMPDTSPRGASIEGEDDDWDFGTGAGFYLNATRTPWSAHYRMHAWVTGELRALVASRFPVRDDATGVTGHSMGGHGALTIALKDPKAWRTVSAFAPICAPTQCPWGEKAFSG